jgi:predicted  nucleic acid-binding Zn-ribbon protein
VVAAVKSGAISINAAAAVASLPEEEQKAVAQAGKDELKQAAKRVREAKRKPREAEEVAPASPLDEVHALQQRVDELTVENQALRQQLADLQVQLEGA